jgi:RNA polymerase sigma factor (sigma-70 family)
MAMRYVFPDGRRRLGFLGSAIAHFSLSNADRISKSASFKQLTPEEKRDIIAAARSLAAHGNPGIKEISLRVAGQLGRSAETVRYTIRKHDQDSPDSAVFPEPLQAVDTAERKRILELLSTGMPLETIAQTLGRAPSTIDRLVHENRTDRLRDLQIDFIHNPLFDLKDADNIILGVLAQKSLNQARATVATGTNEKANDLLMARMPRDLPAFLAQVFQTPVMPQEIETDSFRRMNYLKFKASKLRDAFQTLQSAQLDGEHPADAIEDLLRQAADLKNELLQTNLRVAVHVARKHMRYGADLMELVSDASVWLMRAIEKFDFARGVKFSTYASYSIMKNFARGRIEHIAGRDRKLVTGQEEILSLVGDRETLSVADTIDRAAEMGDLVEVLQRLPARDRELIQAHYGLGDSDAQSLAQLGQKLGVTKARVQQLEAAAIKKLRRLMEERRHANLPQQCD